MGSPNAVLPWAEYQALVGAAGQVQAAAAPAPASVSPLDQLADLREAKGLSQADLARAVGISPLSGPVRIRRARTGGRHPAFAGARAGKW